MSSFALRSWSSRFAALLLVLAVAACSDVGRQDAGPTSPEMQAAVLLGSAEFDQELGAALAAQARFTPGLMARGGVVGTAVGLGSAGRPAVVVLVTNPSVAVPGSLGGVGVRPLVTGEIYALQQVRPRPKGGNGGGGGRGGGGGEDPAPVDRTSRHPRPVPIGVSSGHPAVTAGTIGARVVDGSNNLYALSNNHVYADANAASPGDAVIQPGTFDGGVSPADNIGTLSDFEWIDFASGAANEFDAAIASTTAALLGNDTGSEGYGTPRTETMDAALNMRVQKCGRTTDCTTGNVVGINATVDVNYGTPGVARYVGQIIISSGNFSAGGDSGSLVVVKGQGRSKSDDRKPVALLFAGGGGVTIASPIGPVLQRFGVTIDGN